MQYKDGITIAAFPGAEFPVDCVMSRVIGLLGECPLLREDKDGNDCQQQTGWVEQPNEKIFMQARVHFVRVLGQRTRF